MSELGAETNELLRRARQGTPELPNDVRRRLRSTIMAGAGLSGVVASVSFAKMAGIGVVAASVASMATFVIARSSFEERLVVAEERALASEHALASRTVPLLPPAPVVAATATPAPLVELTPAPAARVIAVTVPPTPAPPPRPAMEPVVDDRSLAAELETVEGILHATDAANWSEARVRLGAYFSRFEAGQLTTEARCLEVLTLCAEHHVDAARALREELSRLDPLNPAVLRLATSCAAN